MPHLQASQQTTQVSSPDRRRGMEGGLPNGGANSSPPATAADHHLPMIQEASKGFLGSSDPVVAMANKAEQAEKVSFDDSVEGGSSPMGAPKTSKQHLVTPSPNASQSRLPPGAAAAAADAKESAAEDRPGSPTSTSSSSEGGGPILTIYGNSRLFHSPIRVKRRVSHSEDDVDDDHVAPTDKKVLESEYLRYGGDSPTESKRPILIRRGSSVGKRKESTDEHEENSTKRQKTDSTQKDEAAATAAHEAAVEAASAMAGMRKTPVASPGKGHAATASSAYAHYPGGAPPRYPPGHGGSYGYGGYPGAAPYHGYAHSYYPPYHGSGPPPPYHGYGHPAPHPYGHAARPRPTPETSGQIAPPKAAAMKRNSSNPPAVARSSPTAAAGAFQQGSTWQQMDKPASANKCVPLKEPIPSRSWADGDKAKDAVLPDFHRIVNYPDFLTKARNEANCPNGKKNCVMCGNLRICSASSMANKGGRGAAASMARPHSREEDTSHIIPRQNKGLCTACDVTVWVVVEDGLEIKWCKGCKNFRPWAAFGSKGSATKCVRCRDRQREKYAMQRSQLRSGPLQA